jgi:RHS repeat-associated protein
VPTRRCHHPSGHPDPNDNAVYETRSEYTYVYGLDLISVTEELPDKTNPPPAVQRYFFPDALGSTRALVNGTDSSIDSYGYDVFGQVRELDSPGTPLRSFLFTGEQYDAKARKQGLTGPFANPGFYYLRERYYDPTIGRFLTPDPVMGSVNQPGSLNRYPYVRNNPVNLVDPTGMLAEGTLESSILDEILDPGSCLRAYAGALGGSAALLVAWLILTNPSTSGAAVLALNLPPVSVFIYAAIGVILLYTAVDYIFDHCQDAPI